MVLSVPDRSEERPREHLEQIDRGEEDSDRSESGRPAQTRPVASGQDEQLTDETIERGIEALRKLAKEGA